MTPTLAILCRVAARRLENLSRRKTKHARRAIGDVARFLESITLFETPTIATVRRSLADHLDMSDSDISEVVGEILSEESE